MMGNKIVIGIDQSYKDTGVTLALDGIVKYSKDIYTENLKNNSEKRKIIKQELNKIFDFADTKRTVHKYKVVVIIERIRLQSQGFINIDYIKSIGALNTIIVDLAYHYGFPIYSADTRAWKSTVIGTSKEKQNKYGIDPKKYPTILWCISHGYESYIINYDIGKRKKGVIEKDGIKYTYNDNIADSIGICLYGFTNNPKLKTEH